MKLSLRALGTAALAVWLACATPAPAQQSSTAPDNGNFDVKPLFATTCGWCHSDGGRATGKGPQLMNTTRDDDFLRDRIKNGKQGAMPAFDLLGRFDTASDLSGAWEHCRRTDG